MTMTHHYTSAELQEFVDGRFSVEQEVEFHRHLDGCAGCRRAYQTLTKLDTVIKQLPVEHAHADLTGKVMARLNVVKKSPLLFRFLENIAYVFGLALVLAIMLTAFVLTGVVDFGEVEEQTGMAGEVMSRSLDLVVGSLAGVGEWMARYVPFATGQGSSGIIVAMVLVIGILAAADRFLGRKFVHRLR